MNSQQGKASTKTSGQNKSKKPRQPNKSQTNVRNQNKNRKSKNRDRYDPMKDCYVNILNDPFNYQPCRLGFNTMVPTEVGTLMYRGNIAANADGSLGILVAPYLGQSNDPIRFNNSGHATTTWSSTPYLNLGQFPGTILTEARIICTALKITPLVASTAAPGSIFAGSVLSQSVTALLGNSVDTLSTYTTLKSLITTNNSILTVSRPLDNSAYEFTINTAGGNASVVFPNSTPVVTITGFPASSNILVEVICHFEYPPVTGVGSGRHLNFDIQPQQEKISKYFPSTEKMWEYTVGRLNPASILDVTSSALNLLTARTMQNRIIGRQQGRLN